MIQANFFEMIFELRHAFACFGTGNDGAVFEGFFVEARCVFAEGDFGTDFVCFFQDFGFFIIHLSTLAGAHVKLGCSRGYNFFIRIVEPFCFESFFFFFQGI